MLEFYYGFYIPVLVYMSSFIFFLSLNYAFSYYTLAKTLFNNKAMFLSLSRGLHCNIIFIQYSFSFFYTLNLYLTYLI